MPLRIRHVLGSLQLTAMLQPWDPATAMPVVGSLLAHSFMAGKGYAAPLQAVAVSGRASAVVVSTMAMGPDLETFLSDLSARVRDGRACSLLARGTQSGAVRQCAWAVKAGVPAFAMLLHSCIAQHNCKTHLASMLAHLPLVQVELPRARDMLGATLAFTLGSSLLKALQELHGHEIAHRALHLR
jgi:hypothetical protein